MSHVQQIIKQAEEKSPTTNPAQSAIGVGISELPKENAMGVWFFLFASMGFMALGVFLISKAFHS